MTIFPDQAALDYDERIIRLVPGYSQAISAMGAVLAAHLPANASILVPGCGTGSEIAVAAGFLPDATFAALDPSRGMLEAAQHKLANAGIASRVTFHNRMLEELGKTPHDAAMLSLVLHFLPDDGAKTAFLQELADRLKPGAPFVMLTPMDEPQHDAGLRKWLERQGHSERAADAVLERSKSSWHCVTPRRQELLLEKAGFERSELLFRAFNYVATVSFRTKTT